MKRAALLVLLFAAVTSMHPFGAKAQQPISEELPLFAPNATPVDHLTDWRVRGFVMLTVARINLHDPSVVKEFGPNGIFIFGGWGLPEEAQRFLAHSLPMHLYPETVLVFRSEGDLIVQLTYSGLTYKSAISTYLWRLQPKGLSYIVDNASYVSLAAPTALRVSPIIEIGIDFGDVTTSEKMFRDVQVFQFNLTNNTPEGGEPGNAQALVSIYRVNSPNAVMMEAQRQIIHGLNQKTMRVAGLTYIVSLTAPPQCSGYRAVQLLPGTYIIQKLTKVGNKFKVDEGPANANLFVVK